MSQRYICNGAIIKCSKCPTFIRLRVLPDRSVILTENNYYANIDDHRNGDNISSFGLCYSLDFPSTKAATAANHGTLTPTTCNPGTWFPWENGNGAYLVRNYPALQTDSYCKCIYGGIITIVKDGQVPGMHNVDLTRKQVNEDSTDKESSSNGCGLDVVDFIPVVGSIRDIGEGLATGSWGMVAFGATFLVLDIAGLFTAGTANVGITAAKTAAKAGMKAASKGAIKKTAVKGVAKQSSKRFLEITAKDGIENTVELSDEYLDLLGDGVMKNAGRNIFEVTTQVAETGAKEAPKVIKAIKQEVKSNSKVKECLIGVLEKGKNQMKAASEYGKLYMERSKRVLKNSFKCKSQEVDKFAELSKQEQIIKKEEAYWDKFGHILPSNEPLPFFSKNA